MMLNKEILIKGTQVNYYFICPRKLWFFSHNVQMEQESEIVSIGKLLHQEHYQRSKKDVLIDSVSIDFVERDGKIIIHEVKKSKKMEKAHFYQLLYYLYFLKKRGIESEGVINYPIMRKREKVILEDEREIEEIIKEIEKIIEMPVPPKKKRKNICRKCSYFELCWI